MTDRDWETFFGIVLGIVGAVALAKLLSEKRCPHCGAPNPRSNNVCQNCKLQI